MPARSPNDNGFPADGPGRSPIYIELQTAPERRSEALCVSPGNDTDLTPGIYMEGPGLPAVFRPGG